MSFFKRKKQTAINSAMDNYSVSVPVICDKKKISLYKIKIKIQIVNHYKKKQIQKIR